MRLKKSNPPFPMLSNEYNYFTDNNFTLEMSSGHNETEEIININTNITNKMILKLLEEKNIALYCRIICPQTRLRKFIKLSSFNEKIVIPAEEIIEDMEVMLQLIAIKDFDITADENFNPIYKGFTFHYDTCNVIGYSNTEYRIIEKEYEDNENLKSFCTIVKDDKAQYKNYDLQEDKIVILVPKNDYENLIISNNLMLRTKQAILVEGAINFVIDEIKRNEDFLLTDYKWLEAFKLACQNAGYEDFESEKFKNEPSYIIAQKILNNPTSDAIKEISSLIEEK